MSLGLQHHGDVYWFYSRPVEEQHDILRVLYVEQGITFDATPARPAPARPRSGYLSHEEKVDRMARIHRKQGVSDERINFWLGRD